MLRHAATRRQALSAQTSNASVVRLSHAPALCQEFPPHVEGQQSAPRASQLQGCRWNRRYRLQEPEQTNPGRATARQGADRLAPRGHCVISGAHVSYNNL
eukprot:3335742-Prymnesium_polylepis.2